ncbi:MAG: hypothetical protein MZV63_50725 [Marinilabiliales bacterium]|nr:hypothetical protein [Marinilabiliales bacterium]
MWFISIEEGPDVLYIDRHYIHEVTSPQAFTGLDERGIPVFRPSRTLATADHNITDTRSASSDQGGTVKDTGSRS